MAKELPATTEEAMRSRHTTIICVTLLVALAASAGAMPADWHGGRPPQPVAPASFARPAGSGPQGSRGATTGTGDDGSWRGFVAASEIVGRLMKAMFACEIDGTGGNGGVARSVAACVARTGLLALRGTPLPRAAAGVSAELLLGLGRDRRSGPWSDAAAEAGAPTDGGDACAGAVCGEGRR